MRSTNPDLPSLQIKHDDKFFSRLLSKENSAAVAANPSFRVYYGGTCGSVPFMWESQPGTPKHYTFSDTSLPPLTPPPSYYSKSNAKPVKKRSRSGLLHALFPKLSSLKKSAVASSPSSSSLSSSSWSVFLPTSPGKYRRSRIRLASPGSSFDSRAEDEEAAASVGSPTSTLCFSIGRRSTIGKRGGCYGW